MKTPQREYLRSTIFGIEDSLVSTTGLIAGLSIGSKDRDVVLLGAAVAIVIEAVSMGAGEYLSEDAVQELDKLKRHPDNPLISGFLMFSSYLFAGVIPLSPVIFFDYPTSLVITMLLALSGLFLLGYLKGRMLQSHPWRSGTKIFVVGGLAAFIGLLVGLVFRVH
jgi:VIT1/CCC1 family predicted Fe2+/Mn2+ transporter